MTRKRWIQIGLELIDAEDCEALAKARGAQEGTRAHFTVMSDLPDFVSPIDGRVYHGRTGMRDHNARHDVVPTADLKGLPTKIPVDQQSKDYKQARKERIIHEVNRNWR
jgi:hypothetical protein